ncbi:MAG: hypothetical protein LC714_03235 [Actinobacteria bacterium]|nr:hypothetical protein [Actinomycetota bacterium]
MDGRGRGRPGQAARLRAPYPLHSHHPGGPNQEFALTLAVELEGIECWAAFAVDTDGNDGPTDAAGGLVSGITAKIIRENGVDSQKALDNNDARKALLVGDALLQTGPTGTNVNDLRVVLVHRGWVYRKGYTV